MYIDRLACMTWQINPTPRECVVSSTECYDGWVWAIYFFILFILLVYLYIYIYIYVCMCMCFEVILFAINAMDSLCSDKYEELWSTSISFIELQFEFWCQNLQLTVTKSTIVKVEKLVGNYSRTSPPPNQFTSVLMYMPYRSKV